MTIREISQHYELPLYSVRRWALKFLSPDKKAGRQKGYCRDLDAQDILKILYGGMLVNVFGRSISEAKSIIDSGDGVTINFGKFNSIYVPPPPRCAGVVPPTASD